MRKIWFGERPYFMLEEGAWPKACLYTAESELLVASSNFKDDVQVWSVTYYTLSRGIGMSVVSVRSHSRRMAR